MVCRFLSSIYVVTPRFPSHMRQRVTVSYLLVWTLSIRDSPNMLSQLPELPRFILVLITRVQSIRHDLYHSLYILIVLVLNRLLKIYFSM